MKSASLTPSIDLGSAGLCLTLPCFQHAIRSKPRNTTNNLHPTDEESISSTATLDNEVKEEKLPYPSPLLPNSVIPPISSRRLEHQLFRSSCPHTVPCSCPRQRPLKLPHARTFATDVLCQPNNPYHAWMCHRGDGHSQTNGSPQCTLERARPFLLGEFSNSVERLMASFDLCCNLARAQNL